MAHRRLSGTCNSGGDDIKDCYDGDTCPTIYLKDPQTVIVQGYTTARDLPVGYSAVTVPAHIVVAAAQELGQTSDCGAAASDVVVEGLTVSPDEFTTPDGESAVEITVAALLALAERLTLHAA